MHKALVTRLFHQGPGNKTVSTCFLQMSKRMGTVEGIEFDPVLHHRFSPFPSFHIQLTIALVSVLAREVA